MARKGNNEKQMDLPKFKYALDMYIRGKWTQQRCAEHLGCSIPTVMKYFNMYYLGEEIPSRVFGGKNGK